MRKATMMFALMVLAGVAADDVLAQNGPNPWRDCGIGAAIFADNPTAAAISNVIWDSGTTAVTSATSSAETCSGDAVRTAQFIDQTYPVLAMETAAGEGEHLTALFQIAQCEPEAEAEVSTALRGSFSAIVGREDYVSAEHADRAFWYYTAFGEVVAESGRCEAI
ncbi:MAG: DUF3015 family protein [Dehalococcoidia bacterium]